MEQKKLIATARMTGIWYLLLAISGVLGFLVFHSQVFVADDPQATLTNLVEHESTARIRLLLEIVIIASQALAAVWFYKLFRDINSTSAFAIAGWGLMNSAAILVSAISMADAIDVPSFASASVQEKILLIQMSIRTMSNAWAIGGLFFGLWLFPMGYVMITSKRMPVWLGRTLILGGTGYIVSTFLHHAGLKGSLLDMLTIPATIGEFWAIGYLLIFGIRPVGASE